MFEWHVCGMRCRASLLLPALVTALLLWQPNGLVVSCLLASIIHEGGHLLAMLAVGVPPQHCTLGAFGMRIDLGSCIIGYGRNLLIAVAGPLTNGIAAVILWAFGSDVVATVHLVLAVLNLLPSDRLDGGEILRCVLCMLRVEAVADLVVRVISSTVTLLLVLPGLWFLFNGRNFTLLIVGGYLATSVFFSKKDEKNLLTRCGVAGIILGTKEAERCPLSPPDFVLKG